LVGEVVVVFAMSEPTNHVEQETYPSADFYLPAVTTEAHFRRLEKVVNNLLDFHGVVLIPDSYNK
jgi:hypothetical protein